MQKEEIFAIIDQLLIDQDRYNKFLDYWITFTGKSRTKKECLAFIEEIFNLPNVNGKEQLAIRLSSTETHKNSELLSEFISRHPITEGYVSALVKARVDMLGKIGDYIRYISEELTKTQLVDKEERQVYLRRAVARLYRYLGSSGDIVITEDQWSEYEPYEWTDYLTVDLDSLLNDTFKQEDMIKWSNAYSDVNELNNENKLRSLRTYVTYLDTYLKF